MFRPSGYHQQLEGIASEHSSLRQCAGALWIDVLQQALVHLGLLSYLFILLLLQFPDCAFD
jgi:hypothetical protein